MFSSDLILRICDLLCTRDVASLSLISKEYNSLLSNSLLLKYYNLIRIENSIQFLINTSIEIPRRICYMKFVKNNYRIILSSHFARNYTITYKVKDSYRSSHQSKLQYNCIDEFFFSFRHICNHSKTMSNIFFDCEECVFKCSSKYTLPF